MMRFPQMPQLRRDRSFRKFRDFRDFAQCEPDAASRRALHQLAYGRELRLVLFA
jgi:hypothetical protein